MLSELAMLREEHLVLIGFALFFVFAAVTIVASVFAVQWRKARQTELEFWFKQEMRNQGLSVDEICRLMNAGTKKGRLDAVAYEPAAAPPPPPYDHRQQPPGGIQHLVRSTTDYHIAGVCGGVAQYLGVSSSWVRFFYLVATVLTGIFPLMIAYAILTFVIPHQRQAVTQPAS